MNDRFREVGTALGHRATFWLLPFDSGLPTDGGCLKRPVAVFRLTDWSTLEVVI